MHSLRVCSYTPACEVAVSWLSLQNWHQTFISKGMAGNAVAVQLTEKHKMLLSPASKIRTVCKHDASNITLFLSNVMVHRPYETAKRHGFTIVASSRHGDS